MTRDLPVPLRSADEAARWLTSPTIDLMVGTLRGVPAFIVNEADHLPVEAAAMLPSLPAVSVGIAPEGTAPAFDVLVQTLADSALVVESIVLNPTAALTCCQVLRQTPHRSTNAGLLLESAAYGTLQAGQEFTRWLTNQDRRARPRETEPPVLIQVGDEVVLTLNRPQLRNAWSAHMRDALIEALRPLASEGDTRSVRLRGSGPAFCGGGDLAEFGTVEDPATAHLIRSAANAAPWLDRLSERLTVELHGAVVGAGIELAAFGGQVLAAQDTTFCLPEVSMGLIPGSGGTVSIPRRIGRQRTAWLCCTSTTIDATTASAWGLVDKVV